MTRALGLAGLAAAALAAPTPTPTLAASIVIHAEKNVVALAGDEAREAAKAAGVLLRACSFNSIEDAKVFSGLEPAGVWARRAAQPHVAVRFDPPREIEVSPRMPPVPVSEALIPLRADYWLIREGERIVLLTKCHGWAHYDLLCTPGVRPHLAASEEASCALFEKESRRPTPRARKAK